MEKAVTKWLNQFRSVQTHEKEVDNVFIPNEGRSTLRIAKTIVPDERASFNETFQSANRELDKLKFNI
jgi:uncharacterized membrane protein